jgi:pyruvate/2-oxoglutarate/acetoin dehydrogenase E1 component
VLFFEHVLLYNLTEELPEGDYTCALDQADLVQEGSDVTIITYSRMRYHCLKAVEQLEADGVSVELIDLISLKPLDMDTISRSIRKTHRVIVVEECMKTGGIGAEHSQRLEAYFHAVPGIKIVACSTPTNAKGLMKAAIRDNNPVLFFEHVLLYNLTEELPEGDYTCALDQADLVQEGSDVTIITYSRMRYHCLKAVEQLEADGVSVELIDLISLKPLDMDTISRSIRKTHRVIVVEECMKTGGIGAELLALITEHCFDDLDARPIRLSSQDIPTPYNGSLENLTIIQPHQIVEAAKEIVSKGI